MKKDKKKEEVTVVAAMEVNKIQIKRVQKEKKKKNERSGA